VVWAGDGEALAAIVAGGLEARGFVTQIVGNHAGRFARGIVGPFDTWAVCVPSTMALDARTALDASGDGPNVVERRTAGTPAGNLRIIARLTFYALPVLAVVVLLALIDQRV
jgi:hypothetical protein